MLNAPTFLAERHQEPTLVTRPSFALASAVSSASEFACTDGWTVTTNGAEATCAMATKSFSESNATLS